MRVFLTGATGFIGSALIPELLQHGHTVLGYARSDDGAAALRTLGAEVHRGDLEDLAALRAGAAQADGVVHCGFIHDFSKFARSCEVDRRVIEALGEVLQGSVRPLVVTAGVPGLPGRVTTEADDLPVDHSSPRASEQTALTLAARGVHASVVRLPQVHDRSRAGFVSSMIRIAREKRLSAWLGDGQHRWSAVHRLDAAPLYRLALEKAAVGGRYHAVSEEGVSHKEIAEAIARGLKIEARSLPTQEAGAHFGPMAFFMGMSNPASAAITRAQLDWTPAAHPGLIDDLDHSTAYAA